MIRGSRTTIQEPAFSTPTPQGSATRNQSNISGTEAKFVASKHVRWYNSIEGKTDIDVTALISDIIDGSYKTNIGVLANE
jgi:hypothetical protein